jgi:hypothetical protein
MRALREWWTLENWTRAADLGSKLLTLVAVLAAINFFSSRADLSVDVSCRLPIQDYLVGRAYGARGKREPAMVTAAIETSNQQLPVPPYPAEDPPRHACLAGNFDALDDVSPTKKQREVVYAIYPEAREGLAHYTPDVALKLIPKISDPKELRFVLTTIEKARYIELTVHVENNGWGKAKNVRIHPPKAFRLRDPDTTYLPYEKPEGIIMRPNDPVVDLASHESATMYLRTTFGNVSAEIDQASLIPDSDAAASINVTLLLIVTMLLFGGLWLPLVVRDIRSRTGSADSTEEEKRDQDPPNDRPDSVD